MPIALYDVVPLLEHIISIVYRIYDIIGTLRGGDWGVGITGRGGGGGVRVDLVDHENI